MAPAQTRKSRVVTIRSDPFRAGFYRQCCKIGVTYQIAFRFDCLAQSTENPPVVFARRNQNASWLLVQGTHVFQSLVELSRFAEDTRMCEDAKDAAQNQLRHPEKRIG